MTLTASASRRRLRLRLLAALLTVALGAVPSARQQPTFRSVVDVIAVDVEVVDRDGNPIGQLGPDAFEVAIEGHRRRVVSASFIRETLAAAPARDDDRSEQGRMFVIAIDNGSFEAGTARPVMEAVRHFVDRLDPVDRVGLYVYPSESWIAPSTQRARVQSTLDQIVGEKQTLMSRYNLRPSEVVDITAESTGPSSFLTLRRSSAALDPAVAELDPVRRVQRRECPDDIDCVLSIYTESRAIAAQLEDQAQASLTGLATLLGRLVEIPGRKAVVLVSAGLLVSDRLEGRPEAPAMARGMGQAAARANATVFTVQIDLLSRGMGTASSKAGSGRTDLSRERAMLGNWLDSFSTEAGGQRIYVPVGSGEFAFDRVLRETSAHYLLGVEPDKADRDGLAHKLHVKVDRRGSIVRSRQWVLIPAKQ